MMDGMNMVGNMTKQGLADFNAKILRKNKLSLVCNIKIEGKHKIVGFESPLVLSNVLSKDLTIGVGRSRLEEKVAENLEVEEAEIEDITIIKSQEAFAAPLTWFVDNRCIYMKKSDGKWALVQKNLFQTLTCQFSLDDKTSKICQLGPQENVAVNIMAFVCKPKLVASPHQYLMSFDEPAVFTNKTFSPLSASVLEANNVRKPVAVMKPDESTAVYYFKAGEKYDLSWSFLDTENNQFTYKESGFMLRPGQKSTRQSPFFHDSQNGKDQFLCIDTLPIMNKDAEGYQGGGFELRDLAASFISSLQIVVYPKYMIVNKTGMDISCGKQALMCPVPKQQSVYLSAQHEKVQFKIDGYEWSQSIDLKTIGVSGQLDLPMAGGRASERLATSSVPYKFAPQKLQLGVKIQQCTAPYSKTTKIEIVHRFVVVNQLSIPIALR